MRTNRPEVALLNRGALKASIRRFEYGWIKLAKKILVQPVDCGVCILLIDQEAQVDMRGAMRNHQDIDVANTAEHLCCDSRRVPEVSSNQTQQCQLLVDFHFAKGAKVFDAMTGLCSVVQSQ
jgi:hypothetical protein